jgi:acyl-CoA synthetase (NDP forming)
MAPELNQLFSPDSIAVIGASQSPLKVGAIVLQNILESGFKGRVFPVNPNLTQINDLKCFPGIKNIIIFSSGFKEIGQPGEELEKQLVDLSHQYQLNVLGPNCLGFASNLVPLNATFAKLINQPGRLRFISQSGAIASGLFDFCQTANLGFSQFITIGNKTVIDENDILRFFIDQPTSEFSPVGLYLESIANGQEFIPLAAKISLNQPVFTPVPSPAKIVFWIRH